MENSYWDCNELIVVTKEEKEEILNYEICMFRKTCIKLAKLQFDQNLLLESLAIHTRILVDLFYNDLFLDENKKKKTDRSNLNDIIAQDFMVRDKDWKKIRPQITKLLYDAREKANKQLAHLSSWRVKLERDGKKGWDVFKISKDLEKVIQQFEENMTPKS